MEKVKISDLICLHLLSSASSNLFKKIHLQKKMIKKVDLFVSLKVRNIVTGL